VATRYTPTGDYFEAMVDEYVEAYMARDLPERNRLLPLMRAEFERQKEEADRENLAIDLAEEILASKAGCTYGTVAYTWRSLIMDIEGYASLVEETTGTT
jgi:hypothetical protein